MATPAQTRNAVDQRLADLWPVIQAKQDAYAAAHGGRHWQGLRSRSIAPADGATELPDVGSTCPTDQPGQPWPAAILSTPMEMALRIDCYESAAGNGYQATVWVTIGANTWTRRAQVGPEPWRVFPWRQEAG